jgi:mRNA interferase HigB
MAWRPGTLFPFWDRARVQHVRVFNRSTVRAFADAHADVRQPLFAWFAEVERADWSGPDDIKTQYPSASFLAGNRVVFNIKGNKYRIVIAVNYEFFAVFIRFIGTHAEYDKIDAATI